MAELLRGDVGWTRPRWSARLLAVLITFALVVPFGPLLMGPAHAADPDVCYAVTNLTSGTSHLWAMDRTPDPTNTGTFIGDMGIGGVKAIVYDPFTGTLYAAHGDTLRSVDPTTGATTVVGTFGTATGSPGTETLNNVTGLAVDPYTGTIYGLEERNNAHALLFVVDPSNAPGALHDPDAFGPGVAYVRVDDDVAPTFAALPNPFQLQDLAIDPVDGALLAVTALGTSPGDDTEHIVTIDRTTGEVDALRTLVESPDIDALTDVGGLDFHNDGTFYGQTGSTSGAPRTLFQIVESATNLTGEPVGQYPAPQTEDFESLACLTADAAPIAGTVYRDDDHDGILDAGEPTHDQAVTLSLYRSADGDATRDPGDPVVATTTSDPVDGTYRFDIAATGVFFVVADPTDLPADSTGWHPAELAVTPGTTDADIAYRMATVGGTVTCTEPATGDCASDPGVAGVTVSLQQGGTEVAAATSGPTGAYDVVGLAPGTYDIVVMPPAGYAVEGAPASVEVSTAGQDIDGVDIQLRRLQADLAITKTPSDPAPGPGDTVTYTIEVTNDGPDIASGVSIVDTLPPGVTLVDCGTGAHDPTAGTCTWDVGTLGSGGVATVTLTVRIDDPTDATDVATVSSDAEDPDLSDNTATSSPETIDLSLNKSVSDTTPLQGQFVTYQVEVRNVGPETATNIVVQEVFPSGLTPTSHLADTGTYDPATGVWTIPALPPGTDADLSITTTVTGAGPFTNVAEIAAVDQYDVDSTPGNHETAPGEDDSDAVTVTPEQADVSLTKAVDDATPDAGDVVTFTLTIDNAGPDPASSVRVEDTLPTGLTFVTGSLVASTGTASEAAGTITWDIAGPLATGNAVATLTFQATAGFGAAEGVQNVATVTDLDQFDPDDPPATGSVDVDASAADVSVSLSGPTAAEVGDTVTMTVTASNAGPDTATGVSVTVTLDPGLTFGTVPAGFAVSADRTTATWSPSDIAAGGNTMETFEVVVGVGAVAGADVAASIDGDQPDPDSSDDTATHTIDARDVDLRLTKIADGDELARPQVGGEVTFRITVDHTTTSTDDATGVEVTDLVPDGYSYIGDSASHGTITVTDVAGRDQIVWDIGALATTETATLDLTVAVDTTDVRYDRQTNTASITAVDQYDISAANDGDGADVDPLDVDLQVTKSYATDSGMSRPEVGEELTFTVTVTNANDPTGATSDAGDATDVTVQDAPQDGLTWLSTDPGSDGTFDPTTGEWTIGTIPAGESRTLRYSVLVDRTADPDVHLGVTNTASATSLEFERDPADDSADRLVDPLDSDLSVAKVLTAGSTTPQVGDQVEFDVTVTNDGPDPAPDIVIEDTLAAGLTLISATSADAADTIVTTGSTATWTLASPLASGSSATLTVVADVTGTGYAGTSNTAEVVAVGGNGSLSRFDPDSTPGDGTGDDHAQVALDPRDADLRLTKIADETAPRFGDPVTFTATVTNDGPDAATAVEVVDDLPATFDRSTASVSTTRGAYDVNTGVWDLGDLPSGSAAELTITATTTLAGTYTNIAQVTDVVEFDPDSVPANHATSPAEDDSAEVDVAVDEPASLAGRVWDDRDGDGSLGVGEDGLASVEVTLTSTTDPTFSRVTTTDALGGYLFLDLPRDDYTVTVTDPPPSPYEPSAPDPAVHSPVTVPAGADVQDVDFGFWRPATIGGMVWYDVNGNGVLDAGTETPTAPTTVVVELHADADRDGEPDGAAVRSATVDTTDGAFVFDELPPGDYLVVVPETVDDAYVLTTDNSPFQVHGLAPAQTVTAVDFGYDDFHPAVTITAGASVRTEAATTVVFPHTVTNTGNVGDTYDLTVTSARGWDVELWQDVDGDGLLGAGTDRLLTTPADTGSLPKEGGTFDLLVVVDVPSGTARGTVDTVTVTATGRVIPTATASATDTTTVIAPRIEVTKTSSTATGNAVPGERIDYRIEVANVDDGVTATALDVDVDDALADPAHGTIDGATIAVDGDTGVPDSFPVALGDLEPGAVRVITFQVVVTRPLPDGTVIVNTATATADNPEGDLLVDQDSAADTVDSSAIPQLVKSAVPASGSAVDPGTSITYQLVLSNRTDATDTWRDVTVQDAEPDLTTTYVAGSARLNGSPVADDGTNPFAVPFALGDLPPGATVTLSFAVRVDDPIADGTVIVNVAEASGSNAGPSYASVTHVVEADPAVALTPDRSASVEPPATVSYPHVLRNDGDVTDTYDLTATSDHGWSTRIHHDVDADGQVDPGEPEVSERTLAPGAVSRLIVTVAVPAGVISGTVDTVTVVATSRTDPAVSADAFDVTTAVTGELEVRKTADPSSTVVNPGMTITYTMMVENVGGAPARDVVLTDETPDATVYRQGTTTWNGVPVADGSAADRNPLSATNGGLELGDLAPGATATIRFSVRVDDPLPDDTLIVNVVDVTGEPALDATDSVTQIVRSSPVLDLDKTADPEGTVEPRQRITYTLTLTNVGNAVGTRAVLTDATPSGTSYVPGSTTIDGAPVTDDGTNPLDPANGGLTLGDLPVGGPPRTVVFAVRVDDPTVDGSVIENEATAAVDEGVTATSQRVRHTVSADPGVAIAPDRSSEVVIPGLAVYAHDVTNTGNVTDTYALSATSSEGWATTLYADDNGDGVWDSTTETTAVASTGPVAPGQRFALIAVVDVPAGAVPGTVDVTSVRASSTTDPAVVAAATDRTTGVAPALRVTKTSTPSGDQVNAGQVISYAVTVRNVGGATATGVRVVDDVPADTTYVPGSATVGASSIPDATGADPNPFASASGGYLLGDIPAETAVTLGFEVRVQTTVPVGREITNVVTATADHTAEPTSASRTHTVTSGPVLDLHKSAVPAAPGPVTARDRITYEITVRNVGQEPATGVRVTDDTPIDTVYVEGSATRDGLPVSDGALDPNPFSSQYGGYLVGDLALGGDVVTLRFTVEVVDPVPDDSTITNAATARSNEDATATAPPVEHEVDVQPAVRLGPDGTVSVLAGGTAVHPLTVTNTGDVTDVYTFSASSSRGWTLVLRADPDGDGVVDAGEPEISATGSLAPGASYAVTLSVTAPATASAGLTDTATIRAVSTTDPSVADPAELRTQVVSGELALVKTASPLSVTPGSRSTYTLTVTNSGEADVHGVVVTDATPAGTTYVPGSTSHDGRSVPDRTSGDGNPVAAGLPVGDLSPGASTTVTFVVEVDRDVDREVIVNAASASSTDAVTARAGTTQSVARSHALDLAPPGEIQIRTGPAVHPHILTNAGDVDDEVVVSATSNLGFPVTVHRDVDEDGALDDADVAVNGAIALTAGSSVALLVVVHVPDGTPGGTEDVTTVRASSLGDPDVSVSVEDRTTIVAPALVVAKDASPTLSTAAGAELSYTIEVTNDGNAPATDVVITDPVPAGTRYLAGTTELDGAPVIDGDAADGNPLDDANGGVALDVLEPGDTATVRFRVVVRDEVVAGAALTNVAFVTSPTTGTLASPPVTIPVTGSGSLAVAKGVDVPGVVPVGAEVTWAVQVTNLDTAVAGDVLVTDQLPIGVAYLPGTTTVDGQPAIDVDGGIVGAGLQIGPMDPGATRLITFRTVTTGEAGLIENVASAQAGAAAAVFSNAVLIGVEGAGVPGATVEPLPQTGAQVVRTLGTGAILSLTGWGLLYLARREDPPEPVPPRPQRRR